MERVGTLIDKLLTQYQQKASVAHLLTTTQMLAAELQHCTGEECSVTSKRVTVVMPGKMLLSQKESEIFPTKEVVIQKESHIVNICETISSNNRNDIKKNNEQNTIFAEYNIPSVKEAVPVIKQNLFDEKRQELNDFLAAPAEDKSFNEKLRTEMVAVADMLHARPIKDLSKAIGVNDRHLFINDLFRGDEIMYERSIKTINEFSALSEAEYWIRRELKILYSWDESNETSKMFDRLIKRRFANNQ